MIKQIRYSIILWSVVWGAISCHTPMNLVQVSPQKNTRVEADVEEKKELVAVIQPYKKKLDDQMNQRLSHTKVELNRSGDNSNLGGLLADFLFEGGNEWAKKNNIPKIHAAILNIGGIRTNIMAGNILLRNVFEVMPFENEVVIMKMKGEDIQEVFNYYERTQKNNPVSHLYIEVEKGKLMKGLIDGETPQKGKDYYIATSDYLAQGGDYMTFFAKGEMTKTGMTLRDLFIEKFKQNPEVKVKDEIRLKFIK